MKFALLLLLCTAPPAAFGQIRNHPPPILEGTITDQNGRPLPHFRLDVIVTNDKSVRPIATDSAGHYRTELLYDGSHQVKIVYRSQPAPEQIIMLTYGAAHHLDIVLNTAVPPTRSYDIPQVSFRHIRERRTSKQ